MYKDTDLASLTKDVNSQTLFGQKHAIKYVNIAIIIICVGGVKVSMVAFQAVDPGSIPGRRICFGLVEHR